MKLVAFNKRKMVRRRAARRPKQQSFAPTPEKIAPCMPVENKNDFEKEIQNTRSNDVLMAALRSRAKEAATVSLQDIRKQLALE